jgi:hypothetical protein
MASVLHVAFQNGFDNDTVVVRINGEPIFRKDGVTDPRTGLAESCETPMRDGPVEVEVELPEKAIRGSLTIQFSGSAYVAVSVEKGSIRYKVSDQPYGYA